MPKKSPAKNGYMIERLFNCQYTKTLIDNPIENIEIKSCEIYHYETYRYNQKIIRRTGRFVFEKDQHEYLVNTNGRYLLVVHENGEIKYQKIINARDYDYLIFNRRVIRYTYFFTKECYKGK